MKSARRGDDQRREERGEKTLEIDEDSQRIMEGSQQTEKGKAVGSTVDQDSQVLSMMQGNQEYIIAKGR